MYCNTYTQIRKKHDKKMKSLLYDIKMCDEISFVAV